MTSRAKAFATSIYGICALACLLPLIAGRVGLCSTCSGISVFIPIFGVTAWCSVAWLGWLNPSLGVTLSLFCTTSHASLIAMEWSSACRVCIGILLLELIICASVAALVGLWGDLRNNVRPCLIRLTTALSGGIIVGIFVLPRIAYLGCPERDRSAEPAPEGQFGETLLLFVSPGCPACAALKTDILPRFNATLKWYELSRCTAQGSRLIRAHSIVEFPTLVITNGMNTISYSTGFDEVEETMTKLLKKARDK